MISGTDSDTTTPEPYFDTLYQACCEKESMPDFFARHDLNIFSALAEINLANKAHVEALDAKKYALSCSEKDIESLIATKVPVLNYQGKQLSEYLSDIPAYQTLLIHHKEIERLIETNKTDLAIINEHYRKKLQTSYEKYKKNVTKLLMIKRKIIWALYQAAHTYHEQMKSLGELTPDAVEAFNKQFAAFAPIEKTNGLAHIDYAYFQLENKSLSELQLFICGDENSLVRKCNTRWLLTSKALSFLIASLKTLSPIMITSNKEVIFSEETLILEQIILQQNSEILTVILGDNKHLPLHKIMTDKHAHADTIDTINKIFFDIQLQRVNLCEHIKKLSQFIIQKDRMITEIHCAKEKLSALQLESGTFLMTYASPDNPEEKKIYEYTKAHIESLNFQLMLTIKQLEKINADCLLIEPIDGDLTEELKRLFSEKIAQYEENKKLMAQKIEDLSRELEKFKRYEPKKTTTKPEESPPEIVPNLPEEKTTPPTRPLFQMIKHIHEHVFNHLNDYAAEVRFGGGKRITYRGKRYVLPRGIADMAETLNRQALFFDTITDADASELLSCLIRTADQALARRQSSCFRYGFFKLRSENVTQAFYKAIAHINVEALENHHIEPKAVSIFFPEMKTLAPL